MSRLFTRMAVSLLLVLFWGAAAAADYRADIGYTQLQTELGSGTPTGNKVPVTQVEADTKENPDYYTYLPDTLISEFTGKDFSFHIVYKNGSYPTYGISSHATQVGQNFYGNASSIAPGITSINNYLANHWLGSGFLNSGGPQPLTTNARVANHSWVGASSDPAANVDVLKRLDWVINQDEYIQVVAMNNSNGIAPATEPLLGSSFNAIAVGLSSGKSTHGSYALDSLYTNGRTRPDLVAPMGATSYATPVVSAAAALLVEVGHAGGATLSTDPLVQSTTNRNGNTIYNAERSEVVKAALMAGASRTSPNLTNTVTPQGYVVDTNNGLNSSYGAGQLNIYNSYHIIAAGEQNSLQDGGAGFIGRYGFDYDPAFGDLTSSNRTASYYFKPLADGEITASLVWNLDVDANLDSATLYNLGLYLYDLTTSELVGSSTSTADNTQNLWLSLNAGQDYLLQVLALTGDDFRWDYGLAWDISTAVAPVPVPGTVCLLGTGFLVLVGFRRKFRS